MNLQTEARDCLYVSWPLPVASAPALPEPLRYERHAWEDGEWVFATALFFRFAGLRSRMAPMVRLSYPQLSLRLYVLDGDDVPSVLFVRMLVPHWVAPVARLLGRQPAAGARFDFPPESGAPPLGDATWRIAHRGELVVAGRPGPPVCGPGPDLGDWRCAVDHFRRRRRGYVLTGHGARSIRRRQPTIEALPMAAEVKRSDFLCRAFPGMAEEHWRHPHSAWLCPQIPVVFELGELHLLPLGSGARRMATVPDGC